VSIASASMPSEPPRSPQPSFVPIGVTIVLMLAAFAAANLLLKRDPPTTQPRAPARASDEPQELAPTGDPDLDRLLREAQQTQRDAEEALRRAEEKSRSLDEQLEEALRRKAEADRAKAEFDAAMGVPATPTPTGK
jgi:hypothetical protein